MDKLKTRVTTFIFDFARVLMFPRDTDYKGKLNPLGQKLMRQQGGRFSVTDHFNFNEELFKYIEFLKKHGMTLVVFTSGSIQEYPEISARLKPLFDDIITARDFDTTKQDPESYEYVLRRIGKNPQECIFIDDTEANIEAAKSVGIIGIHYTSFDELLQQIETLSY